MDVQDAAGRRRGSSAAKAVRDDVLSWSEQRAMNIEKFKTMPEAMQDLWPRPSANFLRDTTWKILCTELS